LVFEVLFEGGLRSLTPPLKTGDEIYICIYVCQEETEKHKNAQNGHKEKKKWQAITQNETKQKENVIWPQTEDNLHGLWLFCCLGAFNLLFGPCWGGLLHISALGTFFHDPLMASAWVTPLCRADNDYCHLCAPLGKTVTLSP